jgi:hypothetical protein
LCRRLLSVAHWRKRPVRAKVEVVLAVAVLAAVPVVAVLAPEAVLAGREPAVLVPVGPLVQALAPAARLRRVPQQWAGLRLAWLRL